MATVHLGSGKAKGEEGDDEGDVCTVISRVSCHEQGACGCCSQAVVRLSESRPLPLHQGLHANEQYDGGRSYVHKATAWSVHTL